MGASDAKIAFLRIINSEEIASPKLSFPTVRPSLLLVVCKSVSSGNWKTSSEREPASQSVEYVFVDYSEQSSEPSSGKCGFSFWHLINGFRGKLPNTHNKSVIHYCKWTKSGRMASDDWWVMMRVIGDFRQRKFILATSSHFLLRNPRNWKTEKELIRVYQKHKFSVGKAIPLQSKVNNYRFSKSNENPIQFYNHNYRGASRLTLKSMLNYRPKSSCI